MTGTTRTDVHLRRQVGIFQRQRSKNPGPAETLCLSTLYTRGLETRSAPERQPLLIEWRKSSLLIQEVGVRVYPLL